MGIGEKVACIFMVLLAVYGCAQAVRRLCLWLTRCPRCTVCCRVAVPRNRAALAPLMRCLQSQAVWGDNGWQHTLVLLPPLEEEEQKQLAILRRETPSVIPVTPAQLYGMLLQLAAEEKEE